jgi:hypothetical protein
MTKELEFTGYRQSAEAELRFTNVDAMEHVQLCI